MKNSPATEGKTAEFIDNSFTDDSSALLSVRLSMRRYGTCSQSKLNDGLSVLKSRGDFVARLSLLAR